MKKQFGLLLTILILVSVGLFLLILMQGREELTRQAGDPNPSVPPVTSESPGTGNPEGAKTPSVGDILAVEEEVLLPSFPVNLKYDYYPVTYTYFVVEKTSVNIRSGPSENERVIRQALHNEKLNYLETVTVRSGEEETTAWYHVSWTEKGEARFGFVKSSLVSRRYFQFDKMEQAVTRAAEYADGGGLTYISNYKNEKGLAPLSYGKNVDARGTGRSQSAPGYPSLSNKEEFIYIGDGTLVRYLFSTGDYIKVQVVDDGDTYYVPQKYIPGRQAVTNLSLIVVVDRNHQNEAVYERGEAGDWALISCTLATTGTTSEYARPTPLGYYFAINKQGQFLYYKDGTYTIQGYAPYTIRFAGGAYIHGVPVNYKFNDAGERITPPKVEYASSIGTVPLSHKCVRNYTSHAKFLYDRYVKGEMLVIVIE